MLLEHLELDAEAALVREAVDEAITNGVLTKELNPTAPYTTEEVGNYIAFWIADSSEKQWNKNNVEIGTSTII